MTIEIRDAEANELPQLARIWRAAWFDAHEALLPTELTKLRTLESFQARLRAVLKDTRVAGPVGAPLGFSVIKGEELYQLFLRREARGTGVAATLIGDAEARLAERGVRTAWLACAIGNDRAARFYEKCGWRRAGTFVNSAETSSGPYPIEVWRYEKDLG